MSELHTPEFLAARNAAMARYTGWIGHDALDPTGPSGHAYGMGVSTRLTSYYRSTHRKGAMDITPQQVIDCLVAADVQNWVLMGLHGYVGFLPMPRATQDVDVMVPFSQREKAAKAIASQWPTLLRHNLPQVVRFMDGGDLDQAGKPKPVVDLMMPWSPFQITILKDHVWVDAETGHRLPTIEAAIVSKYAAYISPHRDLDKKAFDAGDLGRLFKANWKDIDRERLSALAGQVWEQGAAEIIQFMQFAIENKPFPA